jgi:translation initiation factor IF-3
LTFRGREVAHPELGRKILEQVEEAVKDVGRVEIFPRIDGRNMTMVLAPDKRAQAAKQKADAVAAAEEAGDAITEVPEAVQVAEVIDVPEVADAAPEITETDDTASEG